MSAILPDDQISDKYSPSRLRADTRAFLLHMAAWCERRARLGDRGIVDDGLPDNAAQQVVFEALDAAREYSVPSLK